MLEYIYQSLFFFKIVKCSNSKKCITNIDPPDVQNPTPFGLIHLLNYTLY